MPASAPTAASAAAQLGCEVGAIANSLVFSADGTPLLVMTSGAHRVDTVKVAALTGASVVARADVRSARSWTARPSAASDRSATPRITGGIPADVGD